MTTGSDRQTAQTKEGQGPKQADAPALRSGTQAKNIPLEHLSRENPAKRCSGGQKHKLARKYKDGGPKTGAVVQKPGSRGGEMVGFTKATEPAGAKLSFQVKSSVT